jgi:hypothetical protein
MADSFGVSEPSTAIGPENGLRNLSDSVSEVPVTGSRPRALETAKLNAEARFRELMDELRLLTVAFPHLREAFDPEDLPISFLLKRGAVRAAKQRRRLTKGVAARAAGARKTSK